MTETMLTTDQLAKRWDLAKRTLENWRGQGRGPKYIRLGRHRAAVVLYRLADVEAYEEKHMRQTAEAGGRRG